MPRSPVHPAPEQIELPMLLDCLSDPTRLVVVYRLAELGPGESELQCGNFNAIGAKSNLTYHFARLREAGLIRTRVEGTGRYISLRRDDLEARFPGLLESILKAAARDPVCLELAGCSRSAGEAKKKR